MKKSAYHGGVITIRDIVSVLLLTLLLLLALSAVALITFRRHRNISKRSICLGLFMIIALTMAPMKVFSEETDTSVSDTDTAFVEDADSGSSGFCISAEKTVTVDGKEYVIRATLTGAYKNTEFL